MPLTKSDVAGMIRMMKATWPNYNPDPEATSEVLLNLLGDLEPELVKAALLVCAAEDRAFAPSVGEIRARAVRIMAKVEKIPTAIEAYAEVVKMPASMKRTIAYDITDPASIPSSLMADAQKAYDQGYKHFVVDVNLGWTHPIVGEVARMIGWPKAFPTDNPGTDRAQWERTYNSQVEKYLSTAHELPAVTKATVLLSSGRGAGKTTEYIEATAKRLGGKK